MEDNHNGRRPQWKMTSTEDNLYGRQPQSKTTLMEENLNGRRPQWEKKCQSRITLMKEDIKEALQEDDISLFSQPILY